MHLGAVVDADRRLHPWICRVELCRIVDGVGELGRKGPFVLNDAGDVSKVCSWANSGLRLRKMEA